MADCSRVLFHNTSLPHCLQPRNYQIRKQVVHEIEYGDVAVMHIYTLCGIVTDILILIDSLRCFKETAKISMILCKCKCEYDQEMPQSEYLLTFHWNILLNW